MRNELDLEINETIINDDDYIIHGQPSGPDILTAGQTQIIIESDSSYDIAIAIAADMDTEQFWPAIWFINERGSVDLCELYTDSDNMLDYRFIG